MAAKILQIIPYFGQWPEWFDLYLYSCGRNEMIDFVYYTDCPIPKEKYANTKFVSISFSDYCKLVGNRLGFEYHIDKPYKLTDLKPFLGYVHQAELEHYEFWGFGDIDLCYGDLSMILNEKNLKKYDLITTHCYHIAGHFTVMRNNDRYRNLCFEIKDWKIKLCEDKHYGLDEAEWSNLVYPKLQYVRFIWDHFIKYLPKMDFMHYLNTINKLVTNRQHFYEYSTSPAPEEAESWIYSIKQNRLQKTGGIELPYLHFLFFKKTPWLKTDNYWKDDFYRIDEHIETYKSITITNKGILASFNRPKQKIESKNDLIRFLRLDKDINGFQKKRPSIYGDYSWKFLIALRKEEYHHNQNGKWHRLCKKFWAMIHTHYGVKMGWDIPINSFGPGLKINHFGLIVVNNNAQIGAFCDIHQGVNIGQHGNKPDDVPTIGDNVWIGPGAKIFGKIKIADGIAIGANAVVNSSFEEANISIAGNPATKISNKGNRYIRVEK